MSGEQKIISTPCSECGGSGVKKGLVFKTACRICCGHGSILTYEDKNTDVGRSDLYSMIASEFGDEKASAVFTLLGVSKE